MIWDTHRKNSQNSRSKLCDVMGAIGDVLHLYSMYILGKSVDQFVALVLDMIFYSIPTHSVLYIEYFLYYSRTLSQDHHHCPSM